VPGSDGLPPEATNHAVREYLAVLGDAALGGAMPVVPKFVSPADPASRWTGANGGHLRQEFGVQIGAKRAFAASYYTACSTSQFQLTWCRWFPERGLKRERGSRPRLPPQL
jgi:hypothetical protein